MTTSSRSPGFERLALMLALGSVCGCGDTTLSEANYGKIEIGMTLQEVEAILGPGKETIGAAVPRGASPSRWMVWEKDRKAIRIGFKDDKVMLKFKQGL